MGTFFRSKNVKFSFIECTLNGCRVHFGYITCARPQGFFTPNDKQAWGLYLCGVGGDCVDEDRAAG